MKSEVIFIRQSLKNHRFYLIIPITWGIIGAAFYLSFNMLSDSYKYTECNLDKALILFFSLLLLLTTFQTYTNPSSLKKLSIPLILSLISFILQLGNWSF